MKIKKSGTSQSSSLSAFRAHNFSWNLLGQSANGKRVFFGIWDLFLTIFFTILHPIHQIVGLFVFETRAELMENFVTIAATVPCIFKVLAYRLKLKEIQRIKTLLVTLDQRVQEPEELEYFENSLIPSAKGVMYMFFIWYPLTLLSSYVSFAMSSGEHLLCPGWFPFDWTSSKRNYLIAVGYQSFGFFIAVMQNLGNDVFPPVVLSLLSGHVHLLGLRISKLGHKVENTEHVHQDEQVKCLLDYFNLMSLYKTIESTISLALFVQFIAGAWSIGVSVIYMVLYVDNLYAYMYHGIILVGFLVQLFPSCYYGTSVSAEFRQLPYAIFSCNWLERQREYRRNLIILMELAMPEITPQAGGMINIQVNSFIAVCKMAYSLFTVLTATKN